MHNLTIGVLGGMGPRATVEFEMRLVNRFAGGDQAIPKIITINEGTVPDRTAYILGTGESPLPLLRKNLRCLQLLGADILCMPCNTAHADEIVGVLMRDNPTAHIIDMPQASLARAQQVGGTKILILGTEGTRRANVFDKRAGDKLEIIYPDQAGQQLISVLIAAIKEDSIISDTQMDQLRAIISESYADSTILACTELSLLKQRLQSTVRVIDSLDALADACVSRAELYTKQKGEIHDTRYIYA